jgi:hypothetical protein
MRASTRFRHIRGTWITSESIPKAAWEEYSRRGMPRFIRAKDDPEIERDPFVTDEEHRELVMRVQAYCRALVPDPESALTVRDQHLVGIVRPKPMRDVAWRRFG